MYRCIVIDDEPLALNVLAGFIQRTSGLLLADVTTNPVNGLLRVQAGEADLVFLDIQMPELSGIQFMQLAANQCKIILTTAYPEFAIDGYEYNALDYLLKPISFERFLKAIQKLPALSDKLPEQPDYIFVKSEYKLLRLEINEMLYLESLRDYVAIYTVDGNKILTLQSLASFEKELPAHLFCRIHKSYIIALNKINYIEKSKVVINNQYLPVGEFYKTDFWKRINYQQGSGS
jgi:two-component system, LytTR family, response regulator